MEKDKRSWISKLNKIEKKEKDSKAKTHVQDTLEAIKKLPANTVLRKHYHTRNFNSRKWVIGAYRRWSDSKKTGSKRSRELGNITKVDIELDLLDTNQFTEGEKRSGMRCLVRRFPQYTSLSVDEDRVLRLILRQNIWGSERIKFEKTLCADTSETRKNVKRRMQWQCWLACNTRDKEESRGRRKIEDKASRC